jgi:hypothetical protein
VSGVPTGAPAGGGSVGTQARRAPRTGAAVVGHAAEQVAVAQPGVAERDGLLEERAHLLPGGGARLGAVLSLLPAMPARGRAP